MIRRIARSALLVVACAASLSAAPAGIDWGSKIVDEVNDLITAKGGVLVHDGLILLTYIGIGKLLLMLIPMLLRRLDLFHGNWHVTVHFSEIFILLFQIALCSVALNHWMVPFPGTALSLHQFPSVLAKNLTAEFDAATIDDFMGYVRTTVGGVASPSPLALLDVIIYVFILVDMGMLQVAMFVISSFGFIGVGLHVVLGPLFIPLTLTKHFYSWFWNWLQGFFAFSMYRVMATVIGWVWANVYIFFFVHGVGTDYSIAHWIALLPIVLLLTVGFVFSMFKIPAVTSALFSGAGSIGQSYVSAAGAAIRTFLR